jgi:hypothetical protein
MLLGKGAKLLPIGDFVAMSTLIAVSGLHTARRSTTFEPSIESIATQVKHATDLCFALRAIYRFHDFLAQV